MKDVRTELYQLLYKDPIYPKNLYLNNKPMKHKEYKAKVIDKQIKLMHDKGIWVKSKKFGDYQSVITKRHITAGDGKPTATLFIHKKGNIFIEFRMTMISPNFPTLYELVSPLYYWLLIRDK